MTWSLAEGTIEDGSSVLILADEQYQDRPARGVRSTLLIVEVFGSYMMQSQDRRDAFLQSIAPLLEAHGGVEVAGITRQGRSYRFMFYLATPVKRSDVPVPNEITGDTLVATALDPDWMEYFLFVPRRTNVLARIRRSLLSCFKWQPGIKMHAIEQPNTDAALLNVLAEQSDVSKPTDIVFFLYVPSQKQAEICYGALWLSGYRAQIFSPFGTTSAGETDTQWGIISHLHAAPSSECIASATAIMQGLAERSGGQYDGWEAAVNPRTA